jgi:hypothetical protein
MVRDQYALALNRNGQPETTLRNLYLIRGARQQRQERGPGKPVPDWMREIEVALQSAMDRFGG